MGHLHHHTSFTQTLLSFSIKMIAVSAKVVGVLLLITTAEASRSAASRRRGEGKRKAAKEETRIPVLCCEGREVLLENVHELVEARLPGHKHRERSGYFCDPEHLKKYIQESEKTWRCDNLDCTHGMVKRTRGPNAGKRVGKLRPLSEFNAENVGIAECGGVTYYFFFCSKACCSYGSMDSIRKESSPKQTRRLMARLLTPPRC